MHHRLKNQATWLLSAAVVIGLAGCANPPTQPTPTPTPTPTPSPSPTPVTATVTVSGIVLEFIATGVQRPVANLRLKVRDGSRSGPVGGLDLADVVTDSEGRYTIAGVSALVLYFQTAPGSEYRFLCDWYPVFIPLPHLGVPMTELSVVHTSWSGNQVVGWVPGTSVYGIVSERVDGSVLPVAGATVSLDGGVWDPPATTSTNGFFMICRVSGTDQPSTITAQKAGYFPAERQIFGGLDSEVNLELTRK